jgi:hypothetical protein
MKEQIRRRGVRGNEEQMRRRVIRGNEGSDEEEGSQRE